MRVLALSEIILTKRLCLLYLAYFTAILELWVLCKHLLLSVGQLEQSFFNFKDLTALYSSSPRVRHWGTHSARLRHFSAAER